MSHKRLEDAGYQRDKFGNWVKVGGECLNSHRESPKGATGHKVSKELNATGHKVSGAVGSGISRGLEATGNKVSSGFSSGLEVTERPLSQPSTGIIRNRKQTTIEIKTNRVEID